MLIHLLHPGVVNLIIRNALILVHMDILTDKIYHSNLKNVSEQVNRKI